MQRFDWLVLNRLAEVWHDLQFSSALTALSIFT